MAGKYTIYKRERYTSKQWDKFCELDNMDKAYKIARIIADYHTNAMLEMAASRTVVEKVDTNKYVYYKFER